MTTKPNVKVSYDAPAVSTPFVTSAKPDVAGNKVNQETPQSRALALEKVARQYVAPVSFTWGK